MRSAVIAIVALVIGAVVGMYALAPKPAVETAETGDSAAAPATGGEKVRWKMASSFPGALAQLGTLGLRFADEVDAASGSNINIKFFEPGALVPALEIFDAVSSGAIDAGWSSSGYWAGKIPALQFFASVPFGPGPGEYMAWIYHGGGMEMYEAIYDRYNIHAMPCAMISPEGSGWFRTEINSLDDLKGLKMRFFGLGAKVMEKLGVSTQLLAGGDIYPALELGTIDATEYSMPAIDLDLGFYQIAKHYYFPGWHQPSSLIELIVNKDAWNKLSSQQKSLITMACGDSMRAGLAEGEAIQFAALKELESKGVMFHKWSPEILAALESAWGEVVGEMSADDEEFKRVWDSLSAFREDYKLWAGLGYLD